MFTYTYFTSLTAKSLCPVFVIDKIWQNAEHKTYNVVFGRVSFLITYNFSA